MLILMKNLVYGNNPIPEWLSHSEFEHTSKQLPEIPFTTDTVVYTERYPDIIQHVSNSSTPTIYINVSDTASETPEIVLASIEPIQFRRIISKETASNQRYLVFQLHYPSITTFIPAQGNACFVHALIYGILQTSFTLKRVLTTYGKSRHYFREVISGQKPFKTAELQPFFPSVIETPLQTTQHDCIELLGLLLDTTDTTEGSGVTGITTIEQTERKYTATNKLLPALSTVTSLSTVNILNIMTYPDTPQNKDIIDLYQYPIVDEVEGQAYKYKITTRSLTDSDCLIFSINRTGKYTISFRQFIHNTVTNTYFYLKFVIVYYGSGLAGHYVCYFRSDDGWKLYDDMQATITDIPDINAVTDVLSSNGVIFVYDL